MFYLAFKDEFTEIRHALRIEDALKVIAFMLYHTSMEPFGDALNRFAVESLAFVADMGGALDPTPETWD
jgi:hypothetical protein